MQKVRFFHAKCESFWVPFSENFHLLTYSHTRRRTESDTESLLQSGEVLGWSKQPTLQLSEYPESLHFPCEVVERRAWRGSGHARVRVDLGDPVFVRIKKREGRERWVGRGYGASRAHGMERWRGKEDRNIRLEVVSLFVSACPPFCLRFRGKLGIAACAVDVKVFAFAIFAEIVLGTCVGAVHVVIVVAVWIVVVACLFIAVLLFKSQQSSSPPPPLQTFLPLLLLSLRPALPLSPPPSPPSLSPLPFSIPLPLGFISSCSVPHSSQAALNSRCLVPQRGMTVYACPLIRRRQQRCVFLRGRSIAMQGRGVAQGIHQPWDGAQESTEAGTEVKKRALEVWAECGACQLTHSTQQHAVGSLVLCQTGAILKTTPQVLPRGCTGNRQRRDVGPRWGEAWVTEWRTEIWELKDRQWTHILGSYYEFHYFIAQYRRPLNLQLYQFIAIRFLRLVFMMAQYLVYLLWLLHTTHVMFIFHM